MLFQSDISSLLVCRRENLTFLVGTMARAGGCLIGYDATFSKMTYFGDWIRAVIA